MTRDNVLRIVVPTTGVLVVGSLFAAAAIRMAYPALKSTLGYGMLLLWALIPPIWFFFEWSCLCKDIDPEQSARIKHLHDLARNMWLALILVLAAIMGVEWPLQ